MPPDQRDPNKPSSGDGAPLRLLIQGLNYAPDRIGIPKYTTELAEWLVGRGWQVSVVTAAPYYPDWKIPSGYSGLRYASESRNGVRLVRCPLYVPARPTGTRRLLHLGSFALSAGPALLREAMRFRPDVVLAVAPALMAAPLTLAAARAVGCPTLLHVQDFELDIAFGLGLMRGRAAQRLLTRVERAIYRGFDLVSAPSLAMVSRLVAKGCRPESAIEFRNWADTAAIRPDVCGAAIRQELGAAVGDTMALYSGNLSEKQGASLLAAAARLMQDDSSLRMVICGEGPARAAIARDVAGLANVTLLPLQTQERLPALLAAADIHLLPQLEGAEDLVLPSKLSGMLASGRPIVATANPESGIAREIGDAGIVVPAGDAPALARGVRLLAGDPDKRSEMGRRGRERAERCWAKESVLSGFETALTSLVGSARAAKAAPASRSVV